MKFIVIIRAAFAALFLLCLQTYAQDLPADGRGAKWSTLTPLIVNGQQATWNAFGGGLMYLGYEVELTQEVTVGTQTKKKIIVWKRTNTRPAGLTDAQWEALKYWCHGWTFDEQTYSPGGNEVRFILAAGYKNPKPCQRQNQVLNVAAGDVVVYYCPAPKLRCQPGNAGPLDVMHTARYDGNNTFSTKNGAQAFNNAATLAQIDAAYGDAVRQCYEKK